MGFLQKLWDETLAGPMPESGLGKLRKYDSFSVKRSSPAPDHYHDDYDYENNNNNNNGKMMITRSITILRSNSGFRTMESGSAPGSPLGSSTPATPLSRTPGGDLKRFMRRKSSAEG
ncbi:hypothetical protein V6Z12_D09G094400 [Gossypium hirsutum]